MADRRPTSRAWTVPGDVTTHLRKMWERGDFLAAIADGRAWEPVGVSLRAPSPTEIASSFGEVQDWVTQWRGAATARMRVEWRPVGGRAIGTNLVPAKAWLDTREQMSALLGVTPRVRRFTDLVDGTRHDAPTLLPYLAATYPASTPNSSSGIAPCWRTCSTRRTRWWTTAGWLRCRTGVT